MRRRAIISIAIACLSLALGAQALSAAEGELTKLAQRLATLRGEVEGLNEELEGHKTQGQQRLRSLSMQRADLELQLQKEELRLKQLRQARQKHLERVAASEQHHGQLKPALLKQLGQVRAHVERSLPFKHQERLQELTTIEEPLNQGMLTPHKATARLWQFIEDELRLTRESGLYRQTITLDDEEVLVDVARQGMVAMYFRTNDGVIGKVVRRDDASAAWSYERLKQEQDVAQVNLLFESFKKGIRVGFFTLPQAFVIQPSQGATR